VLLHSTIHPCNSEVDDALEFLEQSLGDSVNQEQLKEAGGIELEEREIDDEFEERSVGRDAVELNTFQSSKRSGILSRTFPQVFNILSDIVVITYYFLCVQMSGVILFLGVYSSRGGQIELDS